MSVRINEESSNDPLYPGLRKKRIRGPEFDSFAAAFVEAMNQVFPKACIEWGDVPGVDAIRILETYRTKTCTFNDDIQGQQPLQRPVLYPLVD